MGYGYECHPLEFTSQGDIAQPSYGSTPQGDPIRVMTNGMGDVIPPNYGHDAQGDPVHFLTDGTGGIAYVPGNRPPNNLSPEHLLLKHRRSPDFGPSLRGTKIFDHPPHPNSDLRDWDMREDIKEDSPKDKETWDFSREHDEIQKGKARRTPYTHHSEFGSRVINTHQSDKSSSSTEPKHSSDSHSSDCDNSDTKTFDFGRVHDEIQKGKARRTQGKIAEPEPEPDYAFSVSYNGDADYVPSIHQELDDVRPNIFAVNFFGDVESVTDYPHYPPSGYGMSGYSLDISPEVQAFRVDSNGQIEKMSRYLIQFEYSPTTPTV